MQSNYQTTRSHPICRQDRTSRDFGGDSPLRPKTNLPICKRFVKPHVAAGHDGYSTTLAPKGIPAPAKSEMPYLSMGDSPQQNHLPDHVVKRQSTKKHVRLLEGIAQHRIRQASRRYASLCAKRRRRSGGLARNKAWTDETERIDRVWCPKATSGCKDVLTLLRHERPV